jgi:hypothetical protein
MARNRWFGIPEESGIKRRNQPAFSAINRPWVKQLETTGTSSDLDWRQPAADTAPDRKTTP